MSRTTELLERLAELPGANAKLAAQVRVGGVAASSRLPAGFSLGWPELEACLPDAGIARGHVVQLAALHPGALATNLALRACAKAQQQGRTFGSDELWCAFIEPERSLYAPGVAQAGVRLDRLLVIQPEPAALAQVALRVVRAGVFAVVVIDAASGLASDVVHPLGNWVRAVRQMALALEGQQTGVLLLTGANQLSSLPLPVAQRIELRRQSPRELEVRVAKDRWGRISGWRRVGLDVGSNEVAAAPSMPVGKVNYATG